MKKLPTVALFAAIALLAGAAGFYANRIFTHSEEPPPVQKTDEARNQVASTVVGKPRPDFKLADLANKVRSAGEFDGKVVMVNFWATWCPPCVREMPALNDLYNDYKDKGVVILGVALDTRMDVEQFVDPIGIDYPILLGEETGLQLSLDYGNRLGVLPFTVFVGRDGKIAATHPGEISYQDAESYLKPLM